ncbi:hypothetical protein KP541_08130 [Escherichia coli O111:H8]
MTTITKERLLTIKQWRETYGPGSNVVLPAEEAEELARIALAALEAEPVLYQSCTRPTWNSGCRSVGLSSGDDERINLEQMREKTDRQAGHGYG